MHEFEARLAGVGYRFEWEDVKRDRSGPFGVCAPPSPPLSGVAGRVGSRRRRPEVIPEALSEVEVFEGESVYSFRTEFAGCTGKVFRGLGIAAPSAVRLVEG